MAGAFLLILSACYTSFMKLNWRLGQSMANQDAQSRMPDQPQIKGKDARVLKSVPSRRKTRPYSEN